MLQRVAVARLVGVLGAHALERGEGCGRRGRGRSSQRGRGGSCCPLPPQPPHPETVGTSGRSTRRAPPAQSRRCGTSQCRSRRLHAVAEYACNDGPDEPINYARYVLGLPLRSTTTVLVTSNACVRVETRTSERPIALYQKRPALRLARANGRILGCGIKVKSQRRCTH